MAGGPLNGVAGYINKLNAQMKGQRTPAMTGVLVPTVLQLSADMLSYWTSMTCLYDRYHEPVEGKVTLPVCMFHVKKIVPTYSTETSKKRVILYEPQNDGKIPAKEMADTMRESVMQTIVDNAVQQPTTYNMEIIVPYQPFGRYAKEGIKTITDLMTGFYELIGASPMVEFLEGSFSVAAATLKMVSQAFSIAEKLPGSDGVERININSLEAMAESSRLLCMKMWTGYDYKFVIITGMTPEKQPLEDDVFRATLNLQEMPILSITRPQSPQAAAIDRPWVVKAVNQAQAALVEPLIALTGVRGEKAANDSKKESLIPKETAINIAPRDAAEEAIAAGLGL